MIKWKSLFISILFALSISVGISFLIAALNFIPTLRGSDLFAKLLIAISLIISPITGTVFGLKYYLSRTQQKYILLFRVIYSITVLFLCVVLGSAGIMLIFPVGATIQ